MIVSLADQLESIFRAEKDLRGELSPCAAAPLDQPAASRLRRIVENASSAVRVALRQRVERTTSSDRRDRSACAVDHIGLRSTSRLVDRSLDRKGAQA
jgi:hypothetical protein